MKVKVKACSKVNIGRQELTSRTPFLPELHPSLEDGDFASKPSQRDLTNTTNIRSWKF